MKSELMSTQRSVQAMNQKQMEIEGKINMFANIGKKYLGKCGAFFLVTSRFSSKWKKSLGGKCSIFDCKTFNKKPDKF